LITVNYPGEKPDFQKTLKTVAGVIHSFAPSIKHCHLILMPFSIGCTPEVAFGDMTPVLH
jgi:hypothetical protein